MKHPAHLAFSNKKIILQERVDLLRFSPDERFLAATGADCLMHIWDMQNGEASQQASKILTLTDIFFQSRMLTMFFSVGYIRQEVP
jgi:WD40 repeat protein